MTDGDDGHEPAPWVERIAGRLERLDLQPEEAARRAGLAPDAVARVLAGARPLPRGAPLRRLAEVLDCSIAWIVGLEPDAPPPEEWLLDEQGSFGLLSPDQEALLRAYGRLDQASKAALLRVAQKMAGPEPEPPPATGRRRRG